MSFALPKSIISLSPPDFFSCYLVPALWAVIFAFTVPVFSQVPPAAVAPPNVQTTPALTSAEFISPDGLTAEKLVELGAGRRADLLAARARLASAEGRLRQAGLRPNPTLDAAYGSPRLLGGEPELDFSVGVSQTFELGGKKARRVAVARLELNQVRAEVVALERRLVTEIRQSYTNSIAAARQLDVLEKLFAGGTEIVRITEARLTEGDVAPLDLNLVKVENDRLRVQIVQAKSELDTQLLNLRTFIGAEVSESLRIAPQAERPPRLDLGLTELTAIALKERSDLQAALIGEELGNARIDLAKSAAIPNVAASVTYSRSKGIFDLPGPAGGGTALDTDNELTFGVSVGIPIFNRNQGEIASATGERLQATRTREFLESTIKRDVAVGYRKYRAAAESLVLYSTQIMPRAEINLQTVRAAYGLGEFSVFEVINEQRRMTENVTGYNQALRDYYNALTELETTLGTTLPEAGFAPKETSVLPGSEIAPPQTDRSTSLKMFRPAAGTNVPEQKKF